MAVMESNPSDFDGKKDNKAKGMDTSRFPVENVGWDDICGKGAKDGESLPESFLGKLNARPGARTAFGKPGKFVLPHEDEWEYACRGGRGNKQAFYWGNELDGSQANCDGTIAYNAPNTMNDLQRTCAVEYDNDGKYPKHPWGLKHMHGNVFEWCQNKHNQSNDSRVVRGGSWGNLAGRCRAAVRSYLAPDVRFYIFGFRVLFRLD
jgi:formylglycine-generating enzyme required for sulfatase activity